MTTKPPASVFVVVSKWGGVIGATSDEKTASDTAGRCDCTTHRYVLAFEPPKPEPSAEPPGCDWGAQNCERTAAYVIVITRRCAALFDATLGEQARFAWQFVSRRDIGTEPEAKPEPKPKPERKVVGYRAKLPRKKRGALYLCKCSLQGGCGWRARPIEECRPHVFATVAEAEKAIRAFDNFDWDEFARVVPVTRRKGAK